ncbi:MAG TPA: hypothetical protein VHQ47_09890 [Phycisphaerae bacterium]|nr:hypothetical protein [Phycisphaerae bacterium]
MTKRKSDDAGYMGQVKDAEGAHGRRLSEQQDVGELSAQNRGGTTGRGLEESKRLEEDDREQAAQAQQPAVQGKAEEEQCDTSAELKEIFAKEDRQATEKGKRGDKDVPGAGNSRADRAEEEALGRDTESYADEAEEE